VRWFTQYLDDWPGDLRVRWLLNIAEMTLDDYPDRVPPRYLIPIQLFRSKLDLGRFENVATLVGLIERGPPSPAVASSTISPGTAAPTSSRPRSTSTTALALR
jgi:hypothetical protein